MPTNSISFQKAYSARNEIKFGLEQLIKVTVSATLRKPIPDFRFGHLVSVGISATLQKPTPTILSSYDNNVFRGIDLCVDALHNATNTVDDDFTGIVWTETQSRDTLNQINIRDGLNLIADWRITMGHSADCDSLNISILSREASKQDIDILSLSRDMLANDSVFSDTWTVGGGTDVDTLIVFRELLKTDRYVSQRWQNAVKRNITIDAKTIDARALDKSINVSDRDAKIRPGFSWFYVSEPVVPPIIPIDNSIVFSTLYNKINSIIFSVSAGQTTTTIISKRTYYMLHDIEIKRVSDNKPIQMSSVSISTSQDDWGWKVSGNIVGKTSYDDLRETPYAELMITINGYSWRCFVVDLKESRTFGKGNYSLTAIGRGLELDAPFCMTQSKVFDSARQVVQLANEELTDTGWTLNWTGNDWLVTGGSYSYANQTHIKAIADVAKLSGNFVYSDRANKVLNVRKRYKSLPWLLSSATPDFSIPLNPIRELSKEYVSLPNYNAVYVSGNSNTGILAKVRRDGSDGLIFADTITTNPLITHTDGAYAVGSEYLADNLSHHKYQYSTLLSNDVPLIDVGSIISLTGSDSYKGISQSLSITASMSDKSVKVVQQFEIRRWA